MSSGASAALFVPCSKRLESWHVRHAFKQSRTFFCATLGVACAAIALGTLDSAAQRSTAPVRRIDHIMIRADDPGPVFAFFTDVLQLPVAWPMMRPRDGVATGGVGFGNVNV